MKHFINSTSERQIYHVTKKLVARAMKLVAIDVVHTEIWITQTIPIFRATAPVCN